MRLRRTLNDENGDTRFSAFSFQLSIFVLDSVRRAAHRGMKIGARFSAFSFQLSIFISGKHAPELPGRLAAGVHIVEHLLFLECIHWDPGAVVGMHT